MSAVTVDRAAMVRESHAVLHVAMEAPDRMKAASEIIALADVLDTYAELDEGAVSGEWAFPHLRDEADPDEAALRKVADEVEAAAGDLVKALAACCGITPGGDAGTQDADAGSAE